MTLGTFESLVLCPPVGALCGQVGESSTAAGSTGQTWP